MISLLPSLTLSISLPLRQAFLPFFLSYAIHVCVCFFSSSCLLIILFLSAFHRQLATPTPPAVTDDLGATGVIGLLLSSPR